MTPSNIMTNFIEYSAVHNRNKYIPIGLSFANVILSLTATILSLRNLIDVVIEHASFDWLDLQIMVLLVVILNIVNSLNLLLLKNKSSLKSD